MCPISGLSDPEKGNIDTILKPAFNTNLYNNKIYFKLEKPIRGNIDSLNKLDRYFDDLYEDDEGKQIFFKINSDLTNNTEYEYVSGYAYLDKTKPYGFGSLSTNGYYNYAWVNLAPFKEKIKGINVHPFYFFAWQHLKVNLKKLLFRFNPTESTTKKGKAQMVWQFFNHLKELVDISTGYWDKCIGNPGKGILNSRGYKLQLTKSFLRLNNSDGFKYGDGVRVNKVSIKTNWCDEPTPQYGFVYDYTKTEKIKKRDGSYSDEIISSGVAINEPFTGSEENAYKYVKGYKEHVVFSVDQFNFQEFPINIAGLPGPGVGYSKVTVRSLASDFMLQKANNSLPSTGLYDIPFSMNEISSKGQVVHEFYTAREFPTVFEETSLDQSVAFPTFGIIPFIGTLKYNKVVGSQGYLTEQNNMHGKLRKTTYYGQAKSGLMNSEPVSFVENIYKSKIDIYQRGIVKKYRNKLVNDVVLFNHYKNNSRTSASLVNGELGVHRSLNTRLGGSRSYSGRLGVDVNFDGFIIAIFPGFIPPVWPSFNIAIDEANTGVVDKIIERAGIIDSVRVFDGTSLITTKNLVFDPIGGNVVLSSVQNQFNNLVYNYNIPAKSGYPLMGPAYENIGYQFNVAVDSLCSYSCDSNYISIKLPNYAKTIIKTGDEFLVTMPNDTSDIATCVFNNSSNARFVFDTTTRFQKYANLNPRNLKFYLFRSGKRNEINSSMASIKSLCDPTKNYTPETLSGTLGSALSFKLDNCILDANTTTYSEFWDQAYHTSTRCNPNNNTSCLYPVITMFNPYKRGVRGVWHPQEMYSYLTNRNYDTTSLRYEKLGIYPSFNFYQFDQSNYKYTTIGSNWINTESYRKINENSQVLEQNNALFIPQCILVGDYNYGTGPDGTPYEPPTRVTASIKGSEYFESAFASFEAYENRMYLNTNTNNKVGKVENLCHFDYYSFQHGKITQVYNIIFKQSDYTFVIDKPFTISKMNSFAELYCTDYFNSSGKNAIITNDVAFVTNLRAYQGRNLSQITLNACTCDPPTLPFCRIAISDTIPYIISNITLDDKIKHTGTNSLKLFNNTSFSYTQSSLQLIPGKQYYFSCWLYIPTSQPDLANLGINVNITAVNYTTAVLSPSGNRIDGWQKVEGYFNGPASRPFNVVFNKPSAIANLYVDDLRITPSESQMTGYVYDRKLNKLAYTLDDNNYFTRYVYDKEGMLIGVMKETEKGIKTIQETRKYLPDVPKINCTY
ncbi:MAG: hypothetical protein ABI851_13200 [Saprospiraceae bacterium]